MKKAIIEQFEIFCGKDIKQDDWLWCIRCHRSYQAFEFRKLNDQGRVFLLCHYRDCTGDLPLDSRPWKKMAEENPWFPKTPMKGKVYETELHPAQEEKTLRLESPKSR